MTGLHIHPLALLVLLCLCVVAWWVLKKNPWVAVACGLMVVWWATKNRAWLPTSQPIIVCSARFDGVDAAVVQFHGGGGVYDTSFFIRQNEKWVWFYLDHDGPYWGDVRIQANRANDAVDVLRGGSIVGTYQKETGSFINRRKGITYSKPIGWLTGDLLRNWSSRRYY